MPTYTNTGMIGAPPGLNVQSQGSMYGSPINPYVFEFLRSMSQPQGPPRPRVMPLGSQGGVQSASPAGHMGGGGMFGTNPASEGMGQRQLVPVGMGPGRIPGMGENPMDSGYNPGLGNSLKPQSSGFGTSGAQEDAQRGANDQSDWENYLRSVAYRRYIDSQQ